MISSVRTTALSAFEAPNFKAWSRFRPQDQVARPADEESLSKAKFLFFPKLDCGVGNGNKKSALFISYMPGPEHGAAD
jgi:hypothetical protein